MRVFISSTVFDLIDVRAELAEHLRAVGVTPVLSDDKLSDFSVTSDLNSIETCLVNVASCDSMILVLDRRYGPRLGEHGFDDISATHLEYQHALKSNVPVHVFVRDRLDADYSIWKRNRDSGSTRFSWVGPKDSGLFRLLEEHTLLDTKKPQSNWYSSFSDSIDLKAAVAKRLEAEVLPQRLVEAIQANTFPMLDLGTESKHGDGLHATTVTLLSTLTNVGGAPAFNGRIFWKHKEREPNIKEIIAPGQSVSMSLLMTLIPGKRMESQLIAQYDSPIGITVCDRFEVGAEITANVLFSGGSLVERRYKRTSAISLHIEDV